MQLDGGLSTLKGQIDEFIEGKSANPNLALVFGGDGISKISLSNIPENIFDNVSTVFPDFDIIINNT